MLKVHLLVVVYNCFLYFLIGQSDIFDLVRKSIADYVDSYHLDMNIHEQICVVVFPHSFKIQGHSLETWMNNMTTF